MRKKLYRITIMTPTANIDRGVWADGIIYSDNSSDMILFYNVNEDDTTETIGIYPKDKIFVSSIQTHEEYSNAKRLNAFK